VPETQVKKISLPTQENTIAKTTKPTCLTSKFFSINTARRYCQKSKMATLGLKELNKWEKITLL
jgi:hypothetical protein